MIRQKKPNVGQIPPQFNLFHALSNNRINAFPVFFVSAMTGHNVSKLLSNAITINTNLDIKFPTAGLNKIFKDKNPSNVPISGKKKRPNFLYITQTSSRPIEFIYFVSDPGHVLKAHISFIENKLRENISLKGISFNLIFKQSVSSDQKKSLIKTAVN